MRAMEVTNSDETRFVRVARSAEELFPLIDYCRAGKLKDVSEWIASDKPLDPPPTRKRSRRQTPLQIAIEKGFYSLTELLLDGGCDPFANNTNALYEAVCRDQIDIAKLLIERGGRAESVGMESVFNASQEMIMLFIQNGADPSVDMAYYNGALLQGPSARIRAERIQGTLCRFATPSRNGALLSLRKRQRSKCWAACVGWSTT
jgi:hypothetical protein